MKILTKKYLGRLPSFHNLDLFELDNRNGIYSDFNDICKLPIRCRYFWPASFVSGHPKKWPITFFSLTYQYQKPETQFDSL